MTLTWTWAQTLIWTWIQAWIQAWTLTWLGSYSPVNPEVQTVILNLFSENWY